MSPENVEQNVGFVLDGYARFNKGERVPELWFFTPDAEFHAIRGTPIRRSIVESMPSDVSTPGGSSPYPDLTVEPVEAKGNGDKVFLWVHFSGHGEGSGAPVEMELAHVLTMRDGKAARIAEYFDRDEALEAAGLRE